MYSCVRFKLGRRLIVDIELHQIQNKGPVVVGTCFIGYISIRNVKNIHLLQDKSSSKFVFNLKDVSSI